MITVVSIPSNNPEQLCCDGCKAPAVVSVKDPKTAQADIISNGKKARVFHAYEDANLYLCADCRKQLWQALVTSQNQVA